MIELLRSWPEVWKRVDSTRYAFATVELWWYPPEAFMAEEKVAERSRITWRFALLNINADFASPFATGPWFIFDRTRNVWVECRKAYPLMLDITGDSLGQATIIGEHLISAASAINTHIIFYKQDEAVPLVPGKAMTVADFEDIIKAMTIAEFSDIILGIKSNSRK